MTDIKTPDQIADAILDRNFAAWDPAGEGNFADGLTWMLDDGAMDYDGIRSMIKAAVEADRAQRQADLEDLHAYAYQTPEDEVEDDGFEAYTVVQIDTNDDTGRIRVYVNDGAVWDGDPETTDEIREARAALAEYERWADDYQADDLPLEVHRVAEALRNWLRTIDPVVTPTESLIAEGIKADRAQRPGNADVFPRESTYVVQTFNGRRVIGFKGYEVTEDGRGGWTLSITPSGHDNQKKGA